MMNDYIVLTPIGKNKTYVIDKFIKSIEKLQPLPNRLIFCKDSDETFLIPNSDNVDIIILENSFGLTSLKDSLDRIKGAREVLRNYFILCKDIDYALWIDSDILVPPETFSKMFSMLKKENCLTVNNKYKGRMTEDYWSGSGLMLTTKDACTLSTFFTSTYKDNLIGSEDFMFLKVLDWLLTLDSIKIPYKKGKVVTDVIKCIHVLEEEK